MWWVTTGGCYVCVWKPFLGPPSCLIEFHMGEFRSEPSPLPMVRRLPQLPPGVSATAQGLAGHNCKRQDDARRPRPRCCRGRRGGRSSRRVWRGRSSRCRRGRAGRIFWFALFLFMLRVLFHENTGGVTACNSHLESATYEAPRSYSPQTDCLCTKFARRCLSCLRC